MDYLVFCACAHDLSRHTDGGCSGEDSACRCRRTKLQALDAAIEIARANPWSNYVRTASEDRTDGVRSA